MAVNILAGGRVDGNGGPLIHWLSAVHIDRYTVSATPSIYSLCVG